MNAETMSAFANLESFSETDNSRVLASAANQIIRKETLYNEALNIAQHAIEQVIPHAPINAYAIEGIRGAGKTTQIDLLVERGRGVSGSRVVTPLYTDVIKPHRKDVYMTVFGTQHYPQGGIADTLLVAAFHSDRLARIEKESYPAPLLVDRHWLSFYSLEMYKMIGTGVHPEDAESIVKSIANKWNPVNGTIILNGISVDDCEERILNRGEEPRSSEELRIDKSFEMIISEVQTKGCPLDTFAHKISFIDSRQEPESVYADIVSTFEN